MRPHIIREEGLERKQPDDPVLEDRGFIQRDVHPSGAYRDGDKLAVIGCNCRYCVQEMMARDTRRFNSDEL